VQSLTKALLKGFCGLMVLTALAHADITCQLTANGTRIDGAKTVDYVILACPPMEFYAPLRVYLTLSKLDAPVPEDWKGKVVKFNRLKSSTAVDIKREGITLHTESVDSIRFEEVKKQ
jgi:hypothetical protein